jgi:exodeoxyribonuclease VII small subunit
MVKKKGTEPSESVDFESSLQELETIVRRLEQGGGPLEQALGDYAQAIVLLQTCHGRLEQAERKIEILSGVDANGNPIVREVEDEALSLEDKQESRGQRRAVPRGSKPGAIKHNHSADDEGSLF